MRVVKILIKYRHNSPQETGNYTQMYNFNRIFFHNGLGNDKSHNTLVLTKLTFITFNKLCNIAY